MRATGPLLSVRGLSTGLPSGSAGPERTLVDGVSFELERGRVLALIGPCGSGKTLTALTIARSLPAELRQLGGAVLFNGEDLATLPEPRLRAVRRRGMAIVFQEPALALSGVHTIGEQLASALLATGVLQSALLAGRQRARARASELLARVDLPDPEQLLDTYPHRLSAGMRRRVLIALALAGDPELLIADEPTAGLDATVQSQIIDLLSRLVQRENKSLILVTHDLSAVAELAHEVLVLCDGQVVEAAPVTSLFERPQHPCTRVLLASARHLAAAAVLGPEARRAGAASSAPLTPAEPASAECCRFSARCPERGSAPERHPRCRLERPELGPAGARHRARCFYPELGFHPELEGEPRD
jgi:peptide/nickel transport system ATP-binding protein